MFVTKGNYVTFCYTHIIHNVVNMNLTEDEKFIELARYVMREKGWNIRTLSGNLQLSYAYLRRIISGQVPASEKYWNPLLQVVQKMNISPQDIWKLAETFKELRGTATPAIEAREDQATYGHRKAMMPGAMLEIVTTITLKDDMVHSHNIHMKRLS